MNPKYCQNIAKFFAFFVFLVYLSYKLKRVFTMREWYLAFFMTLLSPSFIFTQEPSMAVFLRPENPLLREHAQEVPLDEIRSKETQEIIDQMFEVARGERTDAEKRSMVGLAAPQIGILKRIILVDIGVEAERRQLGTLRAYINPEITWYSEEQVNGREGCYSVDPCICGIVPRAAKIRLQAFDRDGILVVQEFSDFTARIFQHEVDHLNGKCFPDVVGPQGTLHWVEENKYPDYRTNWEHWPVLCPWDKWLSMKHPK